MNNLFKTTTFSASDARANLYHLIKAASLGLNSFEITLRGSEPVILINKSELESWQETLDILSNPYEIASLRKSRKQKKTISHAKIIKSLGLSNED